VYNGKFGTKLGRLFEITPNSDPSLAQAA
jgi:hypothetical protein